MIRQLSQAKKTTISISLGTIIKSLVVLLLLLGVYYLRDLVLVILTSVVVASAVEPITAWLERRRLPRAPAVLLVYVVTFALVFVLIPLFIFPVVTDLVSLSTTLPSRIGDISGWLGNSHGALGTLTGSLGEKISLSEVFNNLQGTLADSSRGFLQIASFIFGGLLSFVLIVVMSFYLAVQADGIENFLRVVTPIDNENYILNLWRRAQTKIGLWMQGQLLLGLIVGVLVFLGLTIFKMPYALVLAILAATFELIPYFGPILSAVPAVLLGFSISTTQGLIILALYIIIQQFENHLFYPLVVRKMVGVPSLMVIIALIAGAKLAGFLGIILAVPVSVVLIELIHDWEQERKHLTTNA